MKRNRLLAGRCVRLSGLLGAVPLVLLAVAGAPAVAASGAVNAAPRAIPVAGVASFGIGAGQLYSPAGVAAGAGGAVFVADSYSDRVLEYAPGSPGYPRSGVTVAGGRGAGSGLGQLNGPTGVALDRKGDLFVSDSGNNRVLEYIYSPARHRYAPAGRVVAGTGVAGSGPSQLSRPTGLAVTATGNLIVADSGNGRVQEFSYDKATGRFAAQATTIAGVGGEGSGASQLDYPTGIALDSHGDLFVADAGNARVMEYAVTAATQAYPADGTVIISGEPYQWLALDPRGDLFASWSYISGGMVEIRYNPVTKSFASSGTPVGTAQYNWINAAGLAFDASGHLFAAYTAVTSNPDATVWDLVLKFSYDPRSGTYSPVGTVMTQVGRDNLGVNAVAVDSHRDLFVSDVDGSVYEFRPAAAGYAPLGTVIARSPGYPGVAYGGSALALDSRNDLFTASLGSPGVLEYRPNAAGRYPASGSPVRGATGLAGLQVTAIAVDSRNDLFVGSGEQVLEFRYSPATGSYAPSGTVIATTAGSSPSIPAGLALDAHGDLFVARPAASTVQEYLFNAKTGAYAKAGITVADVAVSLGEPTAIAVNGRGDLFVFTAYANSVLEFTGNPATGVYAAKSTVIFGGGGHGWPGTGGVGLDHEGDLFFGNNTTSAVVYEVAARAIR